MTPEQASKLEAFLRFAIASVRAAQAIRGMAGSSTNVTPREAEFLNLHNQALQELEEGTFQMQRFEKILHEHYDKWKDFKEGGITSPPIPEGGEFVTKIKRKP